MKVRSTRYQVYISGKPDPCCDIRDAVYGDLTKTYADGYIEEAREVATNCATMIAALVQALHEGGKLTDEQVLALVSGYERDPLT